MNVMTQKWCENDAKTFIRKDDEMVGKWKGRYDYLSEPTKRVRDLLDEFD